MAWKEAMLLLIVIAISSCSYHKEQITIQAPVIQAQYISHEDIIKPAIIKPAAVAASILNYSHYYITPNFKIEAYGIDNDKIISILSPINPAYFNGINSVKFVYSNKEVSNIAHNGYYIPDAASITIFIYSESDSYSTNIMLHELKHHYCYVATNNAEIEHKGCFLHTPIDDEFGMIK